MYMFTNYKCTSGTFILFFVTNNLEFFFFNGMSFDQDYGGKMKSNPVENQSKFGRKHVIGLSK